MASTHRTRGTKPQPSVTPAGGVSSEQSAAYPAAQLTPDGEPVPAIRRPDPVWDGFLSRPVNSLPANASGEDAQWGSPTVWVESNWAMPTPDGQPQEVPLYPPHRNGRPSAEQLAAEALWRHDQGSEKWTDIRHVSSYAYTVTRALRDAGYLVDGIEPPPLRLKRRSELPRFRDEADLADQTLEYLSQYFTYEREVHGRHCTGRRMIVDAVLRPRDATDWKDDDPAFGVEFKIAGQRSFDTNNFTKWARQAADYTHSEWKGYGKLFVFACPSPLVTVGDGDGWLMSRVLGQFGVGELTPLDGEGWALTMSGDHVVWSERRGVSEGRRWRLKPRVGNS